MSDSRELLKPDVEVTDTELQIELGNLKVENEKLQADYAKLLESSTAVTNKLREELREVRSLLETERADREEVEAELSDLKQKSVPASIDFPEPADLLNQLKARRKKSKADLADVEAILGMMEKSTIPVGN